MVNQLGEHSRDFCEEVHEVLNTADGLKHRLEDEQGSLDDFHVARLELGSDAFKYLFVENVGISVVCG